MYSVLWFNSITLHNILITFEKVANAHCNINLGIFSSELSVLGCIPKICLFNTFPVVLYHRLFHLHIQFCVFRVLFLSSVWSALFLSFRFLFSVIIFRILFAFSSGGQCFCLIQCTTLTCYFLNDNIIYGKLNHVH